MNATFVERIYDAEHPLETYVEVEVSGVAIEHGECITVEDDAEAAFFSVYLRTDEGIAECVADVATRERAEAIADGFAALIGLVDDDDETAAA